MTQTYMIPFYLNHKIISWIITSTNPLELFLYSLFDYICILLFRWPGSRAGRSSVKRAVPRVLLCWRPWTPSCPPPAPPTSHCVCPCRTSIRLAVRSARSCHNMSTRGRGSNITSVEMDTAFYKLNILLVYKHKTEKRLCGWTSQHFCIAYNTGQVN